MYTTFNFSFGALSIEVLCHYSENADRDQVLAATRNKVALLAGNLASVVKTSTNAHNEIVGEFRPFRLALIDANEPILYLSGCDGSEPKELHVYLTTEMDYERSEVWEL